MLISVQQGTRGNTDGKYACLVPNRATRNQHPLHFAYRGMGNMRKFLYIWMLELDGAANQRHKIMETDRKWIVVRIDGKLAGISRDFDKLAEISSIVAREHKNAAKKSKAKKPKKLEQETEMKYREICAKTVSFEELMEIKKSARWEDFILFGTEFQKKVWRKLWELTCTTTEESPSKQQRLLSYSDFADLCNNRSGVRAVAHAIGLNPLPIIIPCHLVVPKEAIDRIREIQRKAESTIFKGADLCHNSILNDNAIDFGEYAYGKSLKRRLISMDMI